MLAPCDLQAVKASGVTFIASLLERVIERCMRKDPEQRWQCAGDLAAELRTIAEGKQEIAQAAEARRPRWEAFAVFLPPGRGERRAGCDGARSAWWPAAAMSVCW